MKNSKAEILREYGPFDGVEGVHGVTFDGENVWFCSGGAINAFDGKYLYQICAGEIHKIDPETGRVLHRIPAPGGDNASGMAWAEGSLWVGQYRERKIRQVDPETGKVLREIESNRFVTGVTWVDGELWHGTWENEQSELRHIEPESGEVLESV